MLNLIYLPARGSILLDLIFLQARGSVLLHHIYLEARMSILSTYEPQGPSYWTYLQKARGSTQLDLIHFQTTSYMIFTS